MKRALLTMVVLLTLGLGAGVVSVYGMNFEHMPQLKWQDGYLFAIILMALVCGGLYLIFKRRDWL